MHDTDDLDQEEHQRPNKSQLKREANALFELGKRLTELEASSLHQLNLPNELLQSIIHAKSIHSHTARKRQLKLIGKLLRSIDTSALQHLIEQRDLQHQKGIGEFHQVEKWRDKLIREGATAMSDFLDHYPAANRQKLNQLIRNAIKEEGLQKPPKSARMLFRYIRELSG